METSPFLLLFFNLASLCTGLAKAGLGALGSLVAPLLLMPLKDPRLAVSLSTVLFTTADLLAVIYYFHSAQLKILLRLIPVSALGMFAAFIIGKRIPIGLYLAVITSLSFLAFAILLKSNRTKGANRPRSKSQNALLLCCGAVAGFASVLGNVSAIFMNLYLTALRLPKQRFVATLALYYFLMNAVKLFVYYFYWNSLDFAILSGLWPHAIWILISLLVGLAAGIWLVHKMSEKLFSFFIVLASLVSLLLLLWRTLQHFVS